MIDFSVCIKNGKPLKDVLIIDAHSHMGPHFSVNSPSHTAEEMIKTMDSLGIDKACISHHSALSNDFSRGNRLVLDALKSFPDRFFGYCTINPHYPESIMDELNRLLPFKGMIGIKIHPACHQVSIDYKDYHTVYEIAEEKRCPVLVHTWGKEAVAALDRIAGEYPGAVFIMGHTGGNDINAMKYAVEVVNRRDNVFGDLALSYTREGNVEWLVKEMGADKLLYASDMPLFDASPAIGRVALADISEDDKRKVFGLNMKKLLIDKLHK